MATGKELARLMECGIWQKWIASKKYFSSAQIFNSSGKTITKDEAKKEYFCHIRILLRGNLLQEEYVQLLADFLQSTTSTSSEFMGLEVRKIYGFYEIIIS